MKKSVATMQLQPESYNLKLSIGRRDNSFAGHLVIEGRKLPPPSKRFTFHQEGLRVYKAQILYLHKKEQVEYEVTRINHLKTFKQVRLHTANLLYPGQYKIIIDYSGKLPAKELPDFTNRNNNLRQWLPCIDEPEARANAKFNVSYTDT